MRGDQLARQWRILRRIEASRNGLSVNDIISLVGVQRRTVYRDLEALQAAGFPLYVEKVEGQSKWMFIDDYKFQVPQPFSITELMSLHLYGDFIKVFEDTWYYDGLQSLLEKVRATLPRETLAYMENVQNAFSVAISPCKDYGRFREMLNQLSKVLPKRERVEMIYQSLRSSKDSHRKVDPYALRFLDGTIYLIGFCHLRGEVRTFVVDRIKLVRATGDTFDIPEDFSLEEYTRNSFKVMQDELHTVKIRISQEWSRWVGEKIWHESQRLEKLPDGGLELTFEVAGLDEIKQWVLSLGKEAWVVSPVELRDLVLQEMKSALSRYETNAADADESWEVREAAES
ncbi:HTH domain-containing protein [Desulfatibacillum alkenivorans DSM 16219]|jgi:predicted DNA-binding transcriptional regulator YafY|uniref:HTH domain-containing protein n=1 Tax=Desulfatibacillum alkenivorans DSM 16219 TaxID=1121393 RepID=A0A1M6NVF5_9BACT|nr:transcriptional regulator [Desulfatibacillum alkenivorans]SHJ99632.1 HTH domain-containing protein [Desulfatibacillum alkenivorans DSM 16219]